MIDDVPEVAGLLDLYYLSILYLVQLPRALAWKGQSLSGRENVELGMTT